jgi:hypothetical protein
MGTRNLTIVQSGGEYKVAQYCQWDGYPSGQGQTILDALRVIDISDFREKVNALTHLNSDEIHARWKLVGADDSGWCGQDVSDKFKYNWPHLSRDFGGLIIEAIASGKVDEVYLKLDFAADSLFCEWAYVIDLDKNTFEVYEGFNSQPLADGERFKFLEEQARDGYSPIKLAAEWPLDNLPDNDTFLAIDKGDEDDE